jgi:hypothetical protein
MFLCCKWQEPMKLFSSQMYCKMFHGFKHPTTQAYCCFSCYTVISEAVSVTKKIQANMYWHTTSIMFLCCKWHKPMKFFSSQMYCKMVSWVYTTQAYCCFSCYSVISKAVSVTKKIQANLYWHTTSIMFLCCKWQEPMKFLSLQMYCKMFHGFKHSTTQAYCCFFCYSVISEAVSVTKKKIQANLYWHTASMMFLC